MFRKLPILLTLMALATVLALLTLLSGSLGMAQQDASQSTSQEEYSSSHTPTSTNATSGDTPSEDVSLLQYSQSAPSTSGDTSDGEAVPVCPEPAAPGTARCHSLVVTNTPGSP